MRLAYKRITYLKGYTIHRVEGCPLTSIVELKDCLRCPCFQGYDMSSITCGGQKQDGDKGISK